MTLHSFNILDRRQDIQRSYLLEASAGTGKTFSIENLFVRLLLEKTCTVDQILVVTFTRAATLELKARIRANLTKAVSWLNQWLHDPQQELTMPDYLQAVCEQGSGAAAAAKRVLEQALFCFAEAQIFTIHSFCQQMLSEYTFDAQASLLDSQQIFGVIRDFFRTQLQKGAYSKEQLNIVLKRNRFEMEKLESRLLHLITRGGQIALSPSFSESFTLFKEKMQQLKKQWNLSSHGIIEDFILQAPAYYKTCNRQRQIIPSLLEKIERFAGLFDQEGWTEKEFDRLLADELVMVQALDPSRLRSKASPPAAHELHYSDLLAALRQKLLPVIQQAGSYSSILARMGYDCQQLLKKYAAEEEKFQYDDLLHAMQRAVQLPGFVEKARLRYRVAIIDEFQDTDAIQWEIFRTLFHGDHCRLYLVGDPKQSIYGFRQADIYTYLEASRTLGEESKASLSVNYRSQASLVKALNYLFAWKHVSGFVTLPRLGISLDYPTMQASGLIAPKVFDDTLGSVHFCLAEAAQGRSEVWPTHEIEKNFFFPFLAGEIIRLKEKDNIQFGQWAVLVRDRYQGDRLAEYCKEKNIPVLVQRQANLTESPAITAMQELFYAVLNPHENSAVRVALGGQILGWTHAQILQLSEESVQVRVYSQLYHLRKVFLEKGFARFMQELMNSSWDERERTVQEALLSQISGMDFYHDLQQLAEIMIEQYNTTHDSGEKLLVFLEECRRGQWREDERMSVRQDLSQDSVRILTLHSSKGLEFDVVFALGLANRTTKREEMISKLHQGKRQWVATAEHEEEAYREHCLEVDAEKMRLLYVAMTRAKYRLYVPIAVASDQNKELEAGQASPIELFFNHFSQDFTTFLQSLGKGTSITYAKISENLAVPSIFREDSSKMALAAPKKIEIPGRARHVFSCTSLTHEKPNEEIVKEISLPHDFQNP